MFDPIRNEIHFVLFQSIFMFGELLWKFVTNENVYISA